MYYIVCKPFVRQIIACDFLLYEFMVQPLSQKKHQKIMLFRER